MLVVCRANLCRSPMAEGLLQRAIVDRGLRNQLRVDSAGTQVTTPGRRPDPRAVRALAEQAVDISRHRARSVARVRLESYERILAVDNATYLELDAKLPDPLRGRLGKLMAYASPGTPEDLPDPYFGTAQGFDAVARQLQALVAAVIDDWR